MLSMIILTRSQCVPFIKKEKNISVKGFSKYK